VALHVRLTVAALVVEDQAIDALLHDAAEDQGGAETLKDIRRRFGAEAILFDYRVLGEPLWQRSTARGGHRRGLRRFGRRVFPNNARTIVGRPLAGCGGVLGLNAYSLPPIRLRTGRMRPRVLQLGPLETSSVCIVLSVARRTRHRPALPRDCHEPSRHGCRVFPSKTNYGDR
jgi:hypothetical protein